MRKTNKKPKNKACEQCEIHKMVENAHYVNDSANYPIESDAIIGS